MSNSTFTHLLSSESEFDTVGVQCCFSSAEIIKNIRDREPGMFSSTFTHFLSCEHIYSLLINTDSVAYSVFYILIHGFPLAKCLPSNSLIPKQSTGHCATVCMCSTYVLFAFCLFWPPSYVLQYFDGV